MAVNYQDKIIQNKLEENTLLCAFLNVQSGKLTTVHRNERIDELKKVHNLQHFVNWLADHRMASARREQTIEELSNKIVYDLLEKEKISVVYHNVENGYDYLTISILEKQDNAVQTVLLKLEDMEDSLNAPLAMQNEMLTSLVQAQKDSLAKTAFLSNMSHDIRTPMNAIIGMSHIALDHIDEKNRVIDSLNKILSVSDHLLSLVNDVLDMSRLDCGKSEIDQSSFELSELVHGSYVIVKPQADKKHQQLEMDIRYIEKESLIGDIGRLRQIFVNIIGNAIKYTGENGHVNVRIRQKIEGDLSYLLLCCKDDGIGMSEEFQNRMFVPFERETSSIINKTEGTGLGLAICKNLIEKMGGSIDVQSQLGEGTTFNICIPLKYNEVKLPQVSFENKHALIIGPQADEDFKNYLAGKGAVVESAFDSEDALSYLTKANINGYYYRYIFIMDLDRQEHFYDFVFYLHSMLDPNSRIILLTSNDIDTIEYRCRKAGISALIGLPFLHKHFLTVLSSFEEETESQKEKGLSISPRKVLLVEDNELNREIAMELLHDIMPDMDTAENGQIALDKFKNSPVGYYDLILMDIQMPVMNGYECAKAIRGLQREDSQKVLIIAVSANAFSEDIRKSKEAGMNGHISKPIDVKNVCETLEKLL